MHAYIYIYRDIICILLFRCRMPCKVSLIFFFFFLTCCCGGGVSLIFRSTAEAEMLQKKSGKNAGHRI